MNVAQRERNASLPRILVVGDFAQRPRPEPLVERVTCEVDLASFPRWLRSLGVWLEMGIPNVLYPNPPGSLAIHLAPKSTTKLTPDAIVAAIPVLANMQECISGLRGLRNFIACIKDFRQLMNTALVQPNLREQFAADIEISSTGTCQRK